MKVEVSFKPFPLRFFVSLGLLVENDQMLWGLALVSRMRVAPTPITKLSFSNLGFVVLFPQSEFLGNLFRLRFRLPLNFDELPLEAPSKLCPFTAFI
jgi:hypothetical protein